MPLFGLLCRRDRRTTADVLNPFHAVSGRNVKSTQRDPQEKFIRQCASSLRSFATTDLVGGSKRPQFILNTDADRKVYLEDRFSTIATLRHVVRETGYHHAAQTRHKCRLNTNQTNGYRYHVDALRLPGISIVRI